MGNPIVEVVQNLSNLRSIHSSLDRSARTAIVQNLVNGGVFNYDSTQFGTDDGVNVIKGWVRNTASTLGFTPAGDVTAATVQLAIEEVRNDTDTKLGLKADKVGTADIEITNATKGIILTASNANRYRITVSDVGALVVSAVV